MKFKKLHPDAKIIQPRDGDAGYDLCAIKEAYLFSCSCVFDNGNIRKIPTGIAIEIPKGYVGLIRDRSSMGAKGIIVCGGVIDSKYRGHLIVCLANITNTGYQIKPGDKIAQLLIVPCITPPLEEVDELEQTERGDKGFGSTGK